MMCINFIMNELKFVWSAYDKYCKNVWCRHMGAYEVR